MALHWVSACQGRRGSVSSSHWTVLSLQGMRTSPFGLLTLFKLRFPFTNFHIPPPLDQDFSLKASLIKSCFPVSAAFLSLSSRKDLSWVYIPHQRKNAQTGNLLRLHWVAGGVERKRVSLFILSPLVIKIIETGDHLKCYVIIKGLATKFQLTWSGHLGQAVLSDSLCLSSRKSSLLSQQKTCKSGQSLVFSLSVLYESKSLLPGVWQHKGWLAVSDKDLSREVKEKLLQMSFLISKISSCEVWCLKSSPLNGTLWKNCSIKTWLFFIEAIRPL